MLVLNSNDAALISWTIFFKFCIIVIQTEKKTMPLGLYQEGHQK